MNTDQTPTSPDPMNANPTDSTDSTDSCDSSNDQTTAGMERVRAFFESFAKFKRAHEAAEALCGAAMNGSTIEDLDELFDIPAPLAAAYGDCKKARDQWSEECCKDELSDETQQRVDAAEAALAEACHGWPDAEEAAALLSNMNAHFHEPGSLHVSRAKHWDYQAAVEAMEDGIPVEPIRQHCTATTRKALSAGAVAALEEYERTRNGDDRKAAARAREWVRLHLYDHFAEYGSNKPADDGE